jgi:uncharacterized coiled-coil protein SlyX
MSDATVAVIIALLVINLVGLIVIGIRLNTQTDDTRNLDQRLTKLEAKVENMPTHRDLMELRGSMAAMAEHTSQMSGQVTTMTQLMKTIQDHLLEND